MFIYDAVLHVYLHDSSEVMVGGGLCNGETDEAGAHHNTEVDTPNPVTCTDLAHFTEVDSKNFSPPELAPPNHMTECEPEKIPPSDHVIESETEKLPPPPDHVIEPEPEKFPPPDHVIGPEPEKFPPPDHMIEPELPPPDHIMIETETEKSASPDHVTEPESEKWLAAADHVKEAKLEELAPQGHVTETDPGEKLALPDHLTPVEWEKPVPQSHMTNTESKELDHVTETESHVKSDTVTDMSSDIGAESQVCISTIMIMNVARVIFYYHTQLEHVTVN